MAESIDKYKVVAALVRSFFDAFSTGVVESQTDGAVKRHTPQAVKKLMLEHYEHIAPAFMDIMFFPLAAMNYKYDETVALARDAKQRGDDMMALVRTACASDSLYDAMVAEYKRNFAALLAGSSLSNAEHLKGYVRCADSDSQQVATEKAISSTVRVVMYAYTRGLSQTKQPKPLRQATLFRLMLDAMNILLLDEAVDFGATATDDLASLFMKVCRTQRNFTAMTDEMDRTYSELNIE